MLDFLNNNYSTLTYSVELLAAVTGLVLFKKYQHTAAKYFIYFLVYVVSFVFISKYTFLVKGDGVLNFLEGTLLEKNYWLGTPFWDIGGPVFFGWYYQKFLVNETNKKILKASVLIFIIVSAGSIILTLPDFFKKPIIIIRLMGAVIIMQCVFYYFLEILKSDRILNFYKSLNFYISCAILMLWLIQTPLAFFQSYFRVADMEYVYLRYYINLLIIFIMYITYIIGLIVSNPDYD